MLEYGQKILHGRLPDLLKTLPDNTTLITSETSEKKANTLYGRMKCDFDFIQRSEAVPFDRYSPCMSDVYVGFGGGTAIDIAKYLAHKYNAKCIAIPSMLSTNVFATDKVAEIYLDKYRVNKRTINSKMPDEVWLDTELLKLSQRENMFGLVDVFSISTALHDWSVALAMGAEDVNKDIYERALSLLDKAGKVALNIIENEELSIEDAFEVISEAGYITNEYGSGRPESGSEHILAKQIELNVRVPHAVAVTCGIAIMKNVQEFNVFNHVPVILKNLGMYDRVKETVKREVLYKAISDLQPRPDRYTIIDFHTKFDKEFFVKNAGYLIERSGLYD